MAVDQPQILEDDIVIKKLRFKQSMLLLADLTPQQFRRILHEPPKSVYMEKLGLTYDNELDFLIRKKVSPVKAELITMKKVREEWLKDLSPEDLGDLERIYMGGEKGTTFYINLTRNWPEGRSFSHYEALARGTAIWRYPDLLRTSLTEEAVQAIVNGVNAKIAENEGIRGIYRVKIAKGPSGGYDVLVYPASKEEAQEYLKSIHGK